MHIFKFHLDDLKTVGGVWDTTCISPTDQPLNLRF